jgi:glycosyltransferase involved in cell wall biosynthesis
MSIARLLIVEPAGNLWGSERALIDVVGRLPAAEVAVCCPPHKPLAADLAKRSIRVLPYFVDSLHEKGKWARLNAALGVMRACRVFRPDVIHLNQAGCFRIALPASILFRCPVTAHVRIFEDADYLAAQGRKLRRLAGIVGISDAIALALRAKPELAATPIAILYDAYVPSAATSDTAGCARPAHRIACVGRLAPIKGQELLIDAMHRLCGSGVGVECHFVGEGSDDHMERLKAMAATGPAALAIKWLGHRDDIVSLLQGCAVLVCPSLREPLGRVILV